jgi:hypothetical protein
MSVPAFTADASIYKATGYYRTGTKSMRGGYLLHPALNMGRIRSNLCVGVQEPQYYECTVWCNIDYGFPYDEACLDNCIIRWFYLFPC